MEQWRSIEESSLWEAMASRPAFDLQTGLSHASIKKRIINAGGGLAYSYATMDIDDATIDMLCNISQELDLQGQYRAMLSGEIMNSGEGRMVLHHLTRGEPMGPVVKNGRNYGSFYRNEQKRIEVFSAKVRSGALKTPAGKNFKQVIQIGIGGSDLGPRALYLALEQWARERGLLKLKASFISNVDPDDANAVLASLDPDSSLFILVSKSGTTQETLANEALVKAWLTKHGLNPSGHMLTVTSETSPLAGNPDYLDSFYIDDYIGGRYSSTSAVGGLMLSLAFGPDAFASMLEGAKEADQLALEADAKKNAALMNALLGIYERMVLKRPSLAILPYTQALSRFPAHLQQLDMESNGKRVKRNGKSCTLPTGPIVFGEPGTNGQHSFYQLLHQGTDIIPIEFIGFKKNQTAFDPDFEGSSARRKLNANLAAQIVAFALGKPDPNPNRFFPGNRPSSLLFGEELDPRALGALLAHYENKVMFQGFAWNINSFDQEGVQLGKKLAGSILEPSNLKSESGSTDKLAQILDSYAELLGAL
ncbi:glucose-6-phosphate isomerase [Spirochaetota bacterium]